MTTAIGIRSLTVCLPSVVRTNNYWRTKYPELIEEAEKASLARLWKAQVSKPSTAFAIEMAPYLGDPFRGTLQRRILGAGETALSLEVRAARQALDAAHLEANDVDCIIVTSFQPDQPGVGNAALLSRELAYGGAAWNLETACNSGIVALQNAVALIRAGEYKNVLVVISCTYSRVTAETDSIGWFMGDGAGAFVVGAVSPNTGVLGTKIFNTAETCETFFYEIDVTKPLSPRMRIRAHENAGNVLEGVSEPYVRKCTLGVLRASGLSLSDIDVFSGNTPTRWQAKFYARALGIDARRVVDTYQLYANVGPALMPINLHYAAKRGLIKSGDLVVLYSVGSVSSAGAVALRWGDVALGPDPDPPAITE